MEGAGRGEKEVMEGAGRVWSVGGYILRFYAWSKLSEFQWEGEGR